MLLHRIRKLFIFLFLFIRINTTNSIKNEILKLEFFILNQFLLLQSIYRYFSYILFGLFFNWIINNNILKIQKKDILSCIFICFIYVLHFESLKMKGYFKLSSLFIWTAHIGFLIIFMNIYFPKNIYKHQLYSMIFVIFLDTILIVI